MLAWLLGCTPPEPRFVEPFDGSSAVDPSTPLRVVMEGVAYPDGEPVPDDLITVVDLDDGGEVPGVATFVDGAVAFVPDEPWRDGGVFGWAVEPPAPRARGPLLDVPLALSGEASFRVGGPASLLDAVLDDGALCLLFSEPLPFVAALEVAGEAVGPLDGEARDLSLPGGVQSAPYAARCVDVDARPGDLVRYTADDGSTSAAFVVAEPLAARWKARHRWTEAE